MEISIENLVAFKETTATGTIKVPTALVMTLSQPAHLER
jgi:hypothetical protein